MEYTYLELAAYLIIYSILGWAIEVIIMAVKERKFCNRGLFNIPLSLSYGIIFDILIVLFSTLNGNFFLQFIASIVVISVVEFLAGGFAKRIWRKNIWMYEKHNFFGIEKKGILFSLLGTFAVMLSIYMVHPVIFMIVQLIPYTILEVSCIIIFIIIILDFISILFAAHKSKKFKQAEELQKVNQSNKNAVGNQLFHLIWGRLNKAYPNISNAEDLEHTGYIFAEGICFDKLVWVFILCAFIGDIIETIYCRITAGVWMSRSSVIYGTFSIVWGIGAVLLTVVLQKMSKKDDRYVFLAGCVIGGVYEYFCSVFTEVFLGTTFWDYSWMPFNIGGRTNLLYCIFWGLLSVVWVKICYPIISTLIEKIPALTGKIATWIIIVAMACNVIVSAAAMVRYVSRNSGDKADNMIETFIDFHYTDELVEQVWPNMKIQGDQT